MSEFKGIERPGLYIMVFFILLTTCSNQAEISGIQGNQCVVESP